MPCPRATPADMVRAEGGAADGAAKAAVLIVDDEPDVCEMYAQILREAGYAVWTASDACSALGLAYALRPDVVLTDQRMPKILGTELCRELRQGMRNPPCLVLMTAGPSIDLGAFPPEKGDRPDLVLMKPQSPEGLVEIVRQALALRPRAPS